MVISTQPIYSRQFSSFADLGGGRSGRYYSGAVNFLILVLGELLGEFTSQRVFQTQRLDTCKVVFTLSGIIQEAVLVNGIFDHFLPISTLSSLFDFTCMAVCTLTW